MKSKCALTNGEIIIYTIILGAVASFSHYAYRLSGNNMFIGLFNPVNESTWEHLKFMFFPFLLWWIAVYMLKNKKCEISSNTWIVAAAGSLAAATLSVIFLYYGYTSALGFEALFITILLVFIAYFIALCLAAHIIKYSKPGRGATIVSLLVIALIFIAFIVFTLCPPELPIFTPQV